MLRRASYMPMHLVWFNATGGPLRGSTQLQKHSAGAAPGDARGRMTAR